MAMMRRMMTVMERKRKDDLEKAADSIRKMNMIRENVQPAETPEMGMPEGANGDAMREEALAMMNKGHLMADVEEPNLPMNMRRAKDGLRTPSGRIRGSMMAR